MGMTAFALRGKSDEFPRDLDYYKQVFSGQLTGPHMKR